MSKEGFYMEQNNELYHYGVLGMRWGIHRARKKGTDYTYKSVETRRYSRAAKKSEKRAVKQESRAKKALEKGDSQTAKLYKESAKNYRKDANLRSRQAKVSADIDKRMQKSVEKYNKGRNLALVQIGGSFGAKAYETAKAVGYSDKQARDIISKQIRFDSEGRPYRSSFGLSSELRESYIDKHVR